MRAAAENRATAVSRAARPISRRRSGSSISRRAASARAASSPGGKSNPVRPSATYSGMPPIRDARTGRPHAWASMLTRPAASAHVEGQTKASAACMYGSTRPCSPRNRTRSRTPSSAASASSAADCSPSPTTHSAADSGSRASARTATSMPLARMR